jgi:hypothetical protein
MRFLVVSEGPTDFQVLSSFARKILPGVELRQLHPPTLAIRDAAITEDTPLGPGWRGVKLWCQRFSRDKLEILLRGAIVGDDYDGFIVHVDASIADKIDAQEECPPASATTDRIRLTIVRDWLQLDSAPRFLILAIPSMETEAWVLAAITPDHPNLECDRTVTTVLTSELKRRHLLLQSTRDGKLKKSSIEYSRLAELLVRNLRQVRSSCAEAERFALDLELFGHDG